MAYESSVPYRAGTERYTSFRVPAVVRARSGVLTPFAGPTRFAAARLSRSAVRRDRDTVGLPHGTGDFSAYSTITFRRIPVEEPA
ncbi:hypothetical protein ACWCXK_37440 [Streptomyces sp. NPDC001739]